MTATTILSDNGVSSGAAGIKTTGGNDGTLQLQTTTSGGTATTAVTIDTSQNVGVGTTSPSYAIDVQKVVTGGNLLRLKRSDVAGEFQIYQATNQIVLDSAAASGVLSFATVGSERARIDSSGNLLVGTTTIDGNGGISVKPSAFGGATQILFGRASTTAYSYPFDFRNGGTNVGGVSYNNTTTAYATSSDYRLKDNVQPMTGALSVVQALKPCTYKWKADGSDGQGFIAHELQEVVPECVLGEKDAVDADGNPKYQGIDTSFLVATLTAAIQELKAELDEVKAQLKGAQA